MGEPKKKKKRWRMRYAWYWSAEWHRLTREGWTTHYVDPTDWGCVMLREATRIIPLHARE